MIKQAITVRAATPADRDFVLGLVGRFAATRARWRGADEVEGGTRRQLIRAFEQPGDGAAILVAVDPIGTPQGFAYLVMQRDFFTDEPHGHLSEIATVADGGGVGGALLDACEAWSRDRGFRYLSLNVNDANLAARRLYRRRAYVAEYRHMVKLLTDEGKKKGGC